jgi:hypothetical protein
MGTEKIRGKIYGRVSGGIGADLDVSDGYSYRIIEG